MANNRIRITFSTTAGDLEDDFPTNQPLKALKREVMARLKLDPSQADQFVVVSNGNPLGESKTLAELGIVAGTVLTIERKEVVKI
jgi:WXG100 protein secretion system (Wss), protein YukD